MYLIVYIRNLKKNLIVPISWVKDVDEHLEKFINNGLNTGQRFLCFYTPNTDAYEENGAPKSDYTVCFDLPLIQDLDEEGCFVVNLKKFKGIVKNIDINK